jgi:hypothetical protein
VPLTTDATLLTTLARPDIRVVELYTFYDIPTLGDLYYTSDNAPHTYDSLPYVPAAITRGDIEQGSGTEVSTLDLEVHLAGWPLLALDGDLDEVKVLVQRAYLADFDDVPSMLSTVFAGIVAEAKPTPTGATLTLKSYLSLGEGECPPRICGPSCPWVFGGTECGVNLATYTSSKTTDSGSTTAVINLTTAPGSNAVKGSTITFPDGSSRTISAVGGSSVTLAVPLVAAPAAGLSVSIVKGCDRTKTACTSYSALAHFGGFTSVPPR